MGRGTVISTLELMVQGLIPVFVLFTPTRNGYQLHAAGGTLQWTSIPSRGSCYTLSCFMLHETLA